MMIISATTLYLYTLKFHLSIPPPLNTLFHNVRLHFPLPPKMYLLATKRRDQPVISQFTPPVIHASMLCTLIMPKSIGSVGYRVSLRHQKKKKRK